MSDNIELLKTEVNEIKKSLNELKNNINFSETEKKDKAEILNKQAEITKQKIQKEINFLTNKTDEESKRKKEEAETLLISCNDITVLYNSIVNPQSTSLTQNYNQEPTENKNIFTKAKEWVRNIRNDVWDKGKRKTEKSKNLLRTAWILATWVWAISLAYKWIKKLFWRWKDNEDTKNEESTSENEESTNENEESTSENDNTNEEDNNNENYVETSESDTKEKEKESFWDRLWKRALVWLWIIPAAWTAAAATTWWSSDKWSDSWTNEETQKSGKTSNESDKASDSTPSDNKPEDSSSKKESEKDNNKEDSQQSKEGLDSDKKTYTNSKSGLTYNLYDQNDPRRWNKKKNGGTTMNQTGCLLTSAAVIDSAFNPSHTPDFYRQNYAGRCPYDSIPKASKHKIQSKVLLPGEKNKWSGEKTQRAITEMIKNLEKWYPVNFMVHWPKHGGNNTLTTGQHYMTAVDIREKDGKKEVFIANTHNGKWWGRFSTDKAFASLRQASTYTPA